MKRSFFRTLSFRIGAAVMLVELAALTALGVYYIRRFSAEAERQLLARVRIPGALLSRNLMTYDFLSDQQTMFKVLGEDLVDGMLVGANGHIFHSLNPDYAGKQISSVPGLDPSWFARMDPTPVLDRVSDSSNSYWVSVTPVYAVDGRTPYLFAYIKMRTTQSEREKRAIAWLFILGSVLTLIATTGVITLFFRWAVARPVEGVLSVMRRVESGDLATRLDIPMAQSELSVLKDGVNSMVHALEQRVVELKRAQRRLATQYALTRVLAESTGVEQAAPRILQILGEKMDWQWGEFWLQNLPGGSPACVAMWQLRAFPLAPVLEDLPATAASWIVREVFRTDGVVTLAAAELRGAEEKGFPGPYRSGFGCPIRTETGVCGALVFYHDGELRPETELLEVLGPLSIQIGQFLQRKQAEAALAKSEERFQLVSRATNDTIWDWDLVKNTRWWSDGFQRLFGMPAAAMEAGLEFWSERLHPNDRVSVMAGLQATIECGDHSWAGEYRFRRVDGSYAFILDRGYVLHDPDGKPVRMIGTMMDITMRKAAEEELKRLTGRILEAQEQERERVARELHDGVNQILSAAKYRIHLLEDQLKRLPSENGEHVVKAKELMERALHEVRLISHNLRPSELDDLGLLPAVRSACEEFQERTGIMVALEYREFPDFLSPEIELTLYRIAQEALNNVEKHSGATRIELNLVKQGMILEMTVRDNGTGFRQRPLEEREPKSGLGLANMKERASFFGGSVSVQPGIAGGIEVRVTIPLAEDGKELGGA